MQNVIFAYESTTPGNWLPLSGGTTTRVGTTASWNITFTQNLPASSTIRATGRSGNGTSSSTVAWIQAYSGLSVAGISVRGNGVVIPANDTTPVTADHTDYGQVVMWPSDATGSISRTFTVQNTGTAPLTLESVSAQIYKVNFGTPSGTGYDGAFTVTTAPVSPVAPGGTTTFTLALNPSGLRQAAVLDYQVYFENNTASNASSFVVRGKGLPTTPTVLNAIGPRSASRGTAFAYTVSSTAYLPSANVFYDPDGRFDRSGFLAPIFTAAPLPAGLSFNTATGAFSGTPTAADAFDITVTYTNSLNLSVNNTFRLTVAAPPNVAPTVPTSIPDQAATQGVVFSYTFPNNTFADANTGDTLAYTTSTLPGWLTFDAAPRTFSGTPGNANVGTVNITVTATDNGSPILSFRDLCDHRGQRERRAHRRLPHPRSTSDPRHRLFLRLSGRHLRR